MPEARLELAQGFNSPTDFKSGASADSATRAFFTNHKKVKAPPHERRKAIGQKKATSVQPCGPSKGIYSWLIAQNSWQKNWRRGAELNRRYRFCRPMHYHFATAPKFSQPIDSKELATSVFSLLIGTDGFGAHMVPI